MAMTEEDFEDWKDSTVTKEVLAWIKSTITASEEVWGAAINGTIPDENLATLRARLSERARLATEIINVSYEDFNDEQERDSPH